jgi:REP element-mobilizing transposase RayT
MRDRSTRKHPAEGVLIFRGQATGVFLTVCTAKRQPGLADSEVHEALVTSWKRANAWLVGFYLIMPNHIHLFCSPQDEDCEIEAWIAYWKREFRRICANKAPNFSHVAFITGSDTMKVIRKNGSTCAKILFELALSRTQTIGLTKVR